MSVTETGLVAADLERLKDTMGRKGLACAEWALDGFSVRIEWADEAPAAPVPEQGSTRVAGTAPAQEQVAPAGGEDTLRSPVAGRLSWQAGPGANLDKGAVVATIDAGGRATPVCAPRDGRLVHRVALADGDFVACGQWLGSLGSA